MALCLIMGLGGWLEATQPPSGRELYESRDPVPGGTEATLERLGFEIVESRLEHLHNLGLSAEFVVDLESTACESTDQECVFALLDDQPWTDESRVVSDNRVEYQVGGFTLQADPLSSLDPNRWIIDDTTSPDGLWSLRLTTF